MNHFSCFPKLKRSFCIFPFSKFSFQKGGEFLYEKNTFNTMKTGFTLKKNQGFSQDSFFPWNICREIAQFGHRNYPLEGSC